jgi:hypothetical protein
VQIKVAPDQKAAYRFHSAMRDIMRISGKDFETVMKHELGAALSGAVRNTKKSTEKSIQKNHNNRPGAQYSFSYGGPESRSGKQYTPGEVARMQQRAAQRRSRGKNGKLVYYFSRSKQPKAYPAWLWRQMEEQRAKALQNKLKARGLAASMFVKIGQGLGIPVQAPAYVKNATHHKKGDMRNLIEVVSRGSGKKYEVGFVNNLTHMNRWAQAGAAFRKALNARANYFSRAMKLEAGGQIKKVLDRYPGLASFGAASQSTPQKTPASPQAASTSSAAAAARSLNTGRRGGIFEMRTSASGRQYKKYL